VTSTTISHFNQDDEAWPVRMLLQTAEEEGADGSVGEPVPSMRQKRPTPRRRSRARFLQSAIDGVVLQPPQKRTAWCSRAALALQSARNSWCSRKRTRLRERSSLRSASGTARQQLRLGKLMFTEARAVGRQNLRGYL